MGLRDTEKLGLKRTKDEWWSRRSGALEGESQGPELWYQGSQGQGIQVSNLSSCPMTSAASPG